MKFSVLHAWSFPWELYDFCRCSWLGIKSRWPNLHISGMFIQSVRCLVDPTTPQRRRGEPRVCLIQTVMPVGLFFNTWVDVGQAGTFPAIPNSPSLMCICVTFSCLKCVAFVSIPQNRKCWDAAVEMLFCLVGGMGLNCQRDGTHGFSCSQVPCLLQQVCALKNCKFVPCLKVLNCPLTHLW